MKNKLFCIILFVFSIFSLVFIFSTKISFAVDFTCYYCKEVTCTSGDVTRSYSMPVTERIGNIIQNIDICGTRPLFTPNVLCSTPPPGTISYAWPRSQGCNSATQTCDIRGGCLDNDVPPPSQCAYARTITTCANDSQCPNVDNLCDGYHCIYQGYLLPDTNQTKYGICTLAPGAQPNPNIPPASGSFGSFTNDYLNQGKPGLPCAGTVDRYGNCPSVASALGLNLSTTQAGLIKTIFGVLLSIVGGIAVLLIIISGYRLIASQGNPERIQEAKEQLTAAIVGLIFIIFSFVFLQTIGVSILAIPGFSQ